MGQICCLVLQYCLPCDYDVAVGSGCICSGSTWDVCTVLPGQSVALARGGHCVPYCITPFAGSSSKLSSCALLHGQWAGNCPGHFWVWLCRISWGNGMWGPVGVDQGV